MQRVLVIFFLIGLSFTSGHVLAQVKKDSTLKVDSVKITDSAQYAPLTKRFNPRVATIRSAILPGWGQIYNKKYWKLPLVYGALGTTGYIFFYNKKTYNILRQVYIYKTDTIPDATQPIDTRYVKYSAAAIRTNRDLFRQNIDYSALFFIIFWGLNVVDATVDAHLKEFDVNDNLSFHFQPGYSQMANTKGLSLVFDIHSPKHQGR